MKKDESNEKSKSEEKNLSRRELLRIALITGIPIVLLSSCSNRLFGGDFTSTPGLVRDAASRGPGPLPAPIINLRSTEICLNSRISYHAGWSGTASDQWLSNVLHACRKAPVTSGPVIIYAATPDNVYVYDPVAHALNVHLAGNHRGDSSAAFQLGFAGPSVFDAGVAQHLAQVASVALWTGTSSQLGSCPRASDTSYANSNWNPAQTVQTGISFGIRSVAGFKTDLKAVSSDGSLPSPSPDGTVFFDNAVRSFKYGNIFENGDLTLQQISQLLWSTYGCTAHNSSNGRAGLTVASAVANYYLTRRVYLVSQIGVHRFHNRIPPGDSLTTADHRIELMSDSDIRNTLVESIGGLPSAPAYIILCLDSSQVTSNWALVEVGYCAGSALVQATSMGLNTHFRTDFTTDERSTIQNLTGIPSSNAPIAIVSSGLPKKLADFAKKKSVVPEHAIPNPR